MSDTLGLEFFLLWFSVPSHIPWIFFFPFCVNGEKKHFVKQIMPGGAKSGFAMKMFDDCVLCAHSDCTLILLYYQCQMMGQRPREQERYEQTLQNFVLTMPMASENITFYISYILFTVSQWADERIWMVPLTSWSRCQVKIAVRWRKQIKYIILDGKLCNLHKTTFRSKYN